MVKEPVISIIVPVLDEEQVIAALLDKLASCRRQGAEVIVIDGGSHDQTVQLAQARADIVLQAARGRASQMQAGADVARADILLFLHADTALPDDAIGLVRNKLSAGRQVWGRFDVRIAGRSRMLKLVARMMNLRSRITGIATGDQAIFVTRAAFVKVDGFPQQGLMEDIELSRRLKRLSQPLCLKPQVTTSGRRWEARGIWRTIFLMWTLRLRYWLGASANDLAKAYR